MDPAQKLLSWKEVARLLGVSLSTVRRLVDEKRLPRPKNVAPKTPRFFRRDVEIYLDRLQRGDFDEENSSSPG